MQRLNDIKPITLSEFANFIKESLALSLPESYWIIAEIADLRENQRGHCYLELVEKKDERIVAQIRATIWAYDFRRLSLKFLKETGEFLKNGMKMLFLATVSFHEVYGLSLNIKDIDTTYTLGEMSRIKREIIVRLQKEGIMDLNKALLLPLVPQRIAIVSSPSAAGYGDFINHIENNIYGYKFSLKLFPAFMQGEEAEISIINALREIKKQKNKFDLAVIIRGGGSQTDLSCFDNYALGAEIARFPLPVITGIGHERDDTISDMVAHTRVKTPTAAAELIISGVRSFEERVINCRSSLIKFAEHLLKDENHKLKRIFKELGHSVNQIIIKDINKINILSHKLEASSKINIERKLRRLVSYQRAFGFAINNMFTAQFNKLNHFERAIHYLDPVNILKRGYSITYHKGKVLKNVNDLAKSDLIQTKLSRGIITSRIDMLEDDLNETAEKTNIQ